MDPGDAAFKRRVKMVKKHTAQSPATKFFPFLLWLKQVSRSSIRSDLIAGLTGALIVLPQGVAYALIAGLPPEYGLYTAIITPVIAGLFGSSWHLVSGPTAAISIVVYGVVSGVTPADSAEFIPLVLTLTLLTGVFQLLFGLLRVGALVNFISHTVVIGFTTGAAFVIAASQLKHILGIELASGLSFVETLIELIRHIDQANQAALILGIASLLAALVFKHLFPKLPNMLLAMATGTVLCVALDSAGHSVALVGALPGNLPPISLFEIQIDQLGNLATGALALAIIALIEAVSIARAIALRSRQRIDGNQEFIGQGLSNITGSLFSCYAGSGSFTRSGVNYDSGAQTPLAAIFSAAFLAIIIIVAPRITAYLPMPVMGGIVILIAWNLIDFSHIRQILRVSREETIILASTFAATLLFPLEFAIYAGVIISIALFLRHSSKPKLIAKVPVSNAGNLCFHRAELQQLPESNRILIVRLEGQIFFGSTGHLMAEFKALADSPHLEDIILEGSSVNYIDLAGAEMLAEESLRLKKSGITLHLSGFNASSLSIIKCGSFVEQIGLDHIHASCHNALDEIHRVTNQCTGFRCDADANPRGIQCPILRALSHSSDKPLI